MADHVAVAGLVADAAGAILLVRALALESPERYVREAAEPATYNALAGIDPPRDRVRAREGAEARAGAALLAAGFVGQGVGALRSNWSTVAALVAYTVAAAVILAALVGVKVLTRRRQRGIFLARMEARRDPGQRYKLYCAYADHFNACPRRRAELDSWVAESKRRLGRHPWDELNRDASG